MNSDYSRSVAMQCATCGGTNFEYEDENSPVRCVGCDRILSRDELIKENDPRVDQEIENIKTEFISDIKKDFKKLFKK